MKAKKKSPKKSIYRRVSLQAKKDTKRRKDVDQLNLGKVVKELRLKKNFSGVDLCERSTGLDPRTLNALEMGRITNPTLNTIESVAEGLSLSVVELFRELESSKEKNLYHGTQKGAYQIHLPKAGIKAISFTPLMSQFFCGKFILGPKRSIEEKLLNHPYPIYISVLVGRIDATVERRKITLREGENICFHGSLKHRFSNPFRKDSVMMLMTAPSLFK